MKILYYFLILILFSSFNEFSQDNYAYINEGLNKPVSLVKKGGAQSDYYLLMNSLYQYWDGANWNNSSLINYKYDDSGRLSLCVDSSWAINNQNWYWVSDIMYTYDNNGNRSLDSIIYFDGVIASQSYKYDQNNNMIKSVYST